MHASDANYTRDAAQVSGPILHLRDSRLSVVPSSGACHARFATPRGAVAQKANRAAGRSIGSRRVTSTCWSACACRCASARRSGIYERRCRMG
eukprot:2175737-Prymnesium_polylepis.4